MILIPAFNEEGAVGDVIREVNQVMPGVPVLVTDDASRDDTYTQAKNAGAGVLRLPHHLGLGGCVQAGYKLAFELGYRYVIRVDGDYIRSLGHYRSCSWLTAGQTTVASAGRSYPRQYGHCAEHS